MGLDKRRRTRDPEATRRRLLEAGIEVFAERGPEGASVSMIVAAAGVNRRMLYHYFGSKEGLYEAVIRHVYGEFCSIEVELAHVLLPVEELLRRMIRAYYEFLASHPRHVRLLSWENLRDGRAMRKSDATSMKAPILQALRIALERGQEEGRFRTDGDVKQLLISCMALSFFYFSNQYTVSQALGVKLTSREAIDARVQHVVGLVLDGIRARSAQEPAET